MRKLPAVTVAPSPVHAVVVVVDDAVAFAAPPAISPMTTFDERPSCRVDAVRVRRCLRRGGRAHHDVALLESVEIGDEWTVRRGEAVVGPRRAVSGKRADSC